MSSWISGETQGFEACVMWLLRVKGYPRELKACTLSFLTFRYIKDKFRPEDQNKGHKLHVQSQLALSRQREQLPELINARDKMTRII